MAGPAAAIFIVEGDDEQRKTLCQSFKRAGYRTRAFASGEAYLEAPEPELPGCLILAGVVPGIGGLGLLRRLLAAHKSRPAVIIAAHGTARMGFEARDAGAFEFLEKPLEFDTLLAVVRRALEVGTHARGEDGACATAFNRLATLTPRERQIVDLTTAGKKTKEIAAETGLAPRTIQHHRAASMRKLGAHSIAELAKIATVAEMLGKSCRFFQ
jgi:two-component system CheB/CheR fusion protein